MFTDLYYLFLILVVSVLMPLMAVKNSTGLITLLKEKPEIKSSFYAQGVILQWVLCSMILLGMWFKDDDWVSIGFTVNEITGPLVILISVIISILVYHYTEISETAKSNIFKLYRHVSYFLPDDDQSYRWGVVMSVTAGICEEIIYRGFLYWQFTLLVNDWISAILINVIFAVAHYSTGLKNALLSWVLGMLFTLLYWLSGDLWISIICHALVDLLAMTLYPKTIAQRK